MTPEEEFRQTLERLQAEHEKKDRKIDRDSKVMLILVFLIVIAAFLLELVWRTRQ